VFGDQTGKAGNYIKQGQFELGTHLKWIMEIP